MEFVVMSPFLRRNYPDQVLRVPVPPGHLEAFRSQVAMTTPVSDIILPLSGGVRLVCFSLRLLLTRIEAQGARNNFAHDLRGTGVNAGNASVGIHAADWILVHVAIAAVQLYAFVRNSRFQLAAIQFCLGRIFRRQLAVVVFPGGRPFNTGTILINSSKCCTAVSSISSASSTLILSGND